MVAGVVVVGLIATGCGGGSGGQRDASAPTLPPRPKATGFITVVVADPIAPVLRRTARAFHAANPVASVTIQSAPSAELVADLEQGRSADLFVAAGTADVDQLAARDLILGIPVPIARRSDPGAAPVVYPVVLLAASTDQATAQAFVGFLRTPTARRILEAGGFRPAS